MSFERYQTIFGMKKLYFALSFILLCSAIKAQDNLTKNEFNLNLIGLSRLDVARKNAPDVNILQIDRSGLLNNSYNPYRRAVAFGIGYKRKLGAKNWHLRAGADYMKKKRNVNYWNLRPSWPTDVNYYDTMLTEYYTYEHRTLALRIGLEKRKQLQNIIIRGGADVLYTFTATNYSYFEAATIKNTIGTNQISIGEAIAPPLKGKHKKNNSMIGIMPNWGIDVVATNHLTIGAEMSITAMVNQQNQFTMREDKLYPASGARFAFNVYPAFCSFIVGYRF